MLGGPFTQCGSRGAQAVIRVYVVVCGEWRPGCFFQSLESRVCGRKQPLESLGFMIYGHFRFLFHVAPLTRRLYDLSAAGTRQDQADMSCGLSS